MDKQRLLFYIILAVTVILLLIVPLALVARS
jgi:inner membrane protein involved in colicin E2 resistance